MTRTLWIDTSSDAPFIAFGDTLLFLERAKDLLQTIREEIRDPHAIQEIRVGCGPGLFTGTRIGVMVAKTLHFALGVPLLGFCSLMRHPPIEEGPFFTFSDAKNRGYYILKGALSEGLLSYDSLLLVKELPASAPPLITRPTIEHLKNIPCSSKIEVVY
ncbi:MAG: hypothetical protein KBC64_03825 [Simkaniaceae bacterium]|nr:hypothetical protein [Simkaniaceae bacterium]